MLLGDLVTISLRQIFRNKRRYRGAIIGTALGIAGLIVVVTMGESVESTLGRNLEILGNATIVKAQWDFSDTLRWHHGQYFESDVEDLRGLPGVMQVSSAIWKNKTKVSVGKKHIRATVGAIDPYFFQTIHIPVARGRRLSEEDMLRRGLVCVIGQTVERELFGPESNPIGHRILVQGLLFEVVGVLGGAEDVSFMETVFIPQSVAKSKIEGMDKIQHLYVRAVDWDTVPVLHKHVHDVLTSNQPGYAESMQILYYEDRIGAIKTIVFIFKFFLYSAIVVTLILGGVGIANVMLAVVNERTKEIGLRKAVGATARMIMSQFLLESLTVSFAGSLVGIFCGLWAVEILQRVFDTSAGFWMLMFSVAASVVISMLLGVTSGMIPAQRASKLSAVEAMRFE